MPGRNRSARTGGDALLKDDLKFYKKAWEKMRDAERINLDRALANKFLWDKLKKLKPDASCEDLMALAHHLEDRGQLQEAIALYQQLLTGPNFQQQDNRELRAHLAALVARANRDKAEEQALRRQAAIEEEGFLPPGRPRGLEPPRGAGVPRGDKPVGPAMPMSPEAYRAELAAMAMAARRRREEARRQEELLDAKRVAEAAAKAALEAWQREAVGRNQQRGAALGQVEERRAREEERRRQFYEDWDQAKAAQEEGPGGPLGGVDEYARRRRAAAAHPDPAAGQRRRPASAGPSPAPDAAAAAAARARAMDENNAANFARLYVPGHPYAPAGGPPQPAAAWPAAAPASPAAAARRGAAAGVKAPFARPDVDRPKVAIDPKAVRARQQVFLDKHRKPEPLVRQEVPLRRRKEAQRQPTQPQIAVGAMGGYAAW